MDIVVVLPVHLFEKNKLVGARSHVYIYEHPKYFRTDITHAMKLVLHRASMKYYADYITREYSCAVSYIECCPPRELFARIRRDFADSTRAPSIGMFDPVDFEIVETMRDGNIKIYDCARFLTPSAELFKNTWKTAGAFYRWQRRRLNILMEDDRGAGDTGGNSGPASIPAGGSWSYDTENRIRAPPEIVELFAKMDSETLGAKYTDGRKYVSEAAKYVARMSGLNKYQSMDLYLPITHAGARAHLARALDRLQYFEYQDAMSADFIIGPHSMLSPLLNIGLITPDIVISELLAKLSAGRNRIDWKRSKISLAAAEGFIRQIIGWREYVRACYMSRYDELAAVAVGRPRTEYMRIRPGSAWYRGSVGIAPVDMVIARANKYAYAHHIERLMIAGNFMLLSRVHPADAYRWFMSMFIDSYDVFMLPNVYGMSQSNIIVTRMYFSSHSYLLRMGLNLEDKTWYDIWDALYYKYIADNSTELAKNYATASAVYHWKNKTKKERDQIMAVVARFNKTQ